MTRVIRRRFHLPTLIVTVVACLIVAGLAMFVFIRIQQQAPIPAAIRKQAHFPVFIPTQGVSINKTSYKFDPGLGVLSFTGTITADGQAVTFAEQASPGAFTDIPNYYPQFLRTLFEYQAFDGLQGTIHLTHPKDAGQAAVLSAKGTLIFARVAKDEPQSVWLPIFNSMRIYVL